MSKAITDVIAERQRQIDAEGWSSEHDDLHQPEELALAACCYSVAPDANAPQPIIWPWSKKWWKPKDRRSNMVRAAALLLAEIDKLDRISNDENKNC